MRADRGSTQTFELLKNRCPKISQVRLFAESQGFQVSRPRATSIFVFVTNDRPTADPDSLVVEAYDHYLRSSTWQHPEPCSWSTYQASDETWFAVGTVGILDKDDSL